MAKRPAQTKPRRTRKHVERELRTLEHAFAFLLELEVELVATNQRIIDAQARLDAAVAQLTTDVDALKAGAQTTADVDAQVNALDATAAKVNDLDASVKA